MSRDFDSTNKTKPLNNRMIHRAKWNFEAYPENNGIGENMIKRTDSLEMIHYGLIDHKNNSIIPDESYLVFTNSGRVFDFVADSYALMRLNYRTALERGVISNLNSSFGNLDMLSSYSNPRLKYGRYLQSIFQYYNETHIPNSIGITSIASYDDYVKHFFKFFLEQGKELALTMTKWNTSTRSSVLDTGLAFSYADIPFDADQQKIDQIIDHPCFEYIKNLSMNMSFSIIHNSPNVLLYDVASPAGASIRESYGLYNLESLFNNRYIKTYTLDNNELYNNININYNKYALKNSQTKVVKVKNCKTVSEYIRLQPVLLTKRPYSDLEEIYMYIKVRNVEENNIFPPQKIEEIYKKAKYFYKKLDKPSAMSYTNSMFRDQVWNKNNGFHDIKAKLEGQTTTESQRQQVSGNPLATRGGGRSSY